MNQTVKQPNVFATITTRLLSGIQETASVIEQQSDAKLIAKKLRESTALVEQFEQWSKTLPESRVRETILTLIAALDKTLRDGVRSNKIIPDIYGGSTQNLTAPFLQEVLLMVGPEISISEDKMVLRTQVSKQTAYLWNAETLTKGIETQGILYGIVPKQINKVLAFPGKPFQVAKGKKPIAGNDAIMEDCLNLASLDGSPKITSSGSADFKRPNQYRNIAKGQVILKKIPATEGEPGMNLFGETIPAKNGIDLLFPKVPNTIISDDGLSMLSQVDGCCYFEKDQLILVPGLVIENNVDYSTGNVDVEVAVTINGDVLSGFSVISNHDIIVKGVVEAAYLSAKGHLFLDTGVQGKEEAQLYSEKSLHARFINGARAVIKKDVFINGSLMHANIACRRLMLNGENAEIIGSKINAADDVCADIIGSEIGVKTRIVLGRDLDVIQEEIDHFKEEQTQLYDKQERYETTYKTLIKYKQQKGSLPKDKQPLLEKTKLALVKIQEKLNQTNQRLEQAKEDLAYAQTATRMVRARKTIYPGTEIKILGKAISFKVPTGPASITLVNDELKILPYQERTFGEEDEVE